MMSTTSSRTSRPRILICDDNPENYLLLKKYLEKEGYACANRVQTFEEMDEKLNAAQKQRDWYQLVMIDIDLSMTGEREDGISLYYRLIDRFPHESYIIYTSQSINKPFRKKMNQLMYRGPQLLLLDEMLKEENIKLTLSRLIQDVNPRTIFLVHGRNAQKTAMIKYFLEKGLGLDVIDWERARENIKSSTEQLFEIALTGIEMSHTTLVLFTDDEDVRLRQEFLEESDFEYQHKHLYKRQSRPNVFVEAGYAYGKRPKRTIFVEWPDEQSLFSGPSDFAGIDVVKFLNDPVHREQLRSRLESTRCILEPSSRWKTMTLRSK